MRRLHGKRIKNKPVFPPVLGGGIHCGTGGTGQIISYKANHSKIKIKEE